MVFFPTPSFSLFIFIFIVAICPLCGAIGDDRKIYIVYMGALPEGEYFPTSNHLSMLEEVLEDSSTPSSFVRSYHRSFNGFAAKLNEQESEKLASKEGVISVFPSRTLQLQTTRSWDFIGLSTTVIRKPKVESDLIIGILDDGIWPESESFSDKGFSAPPMKWKGACEGGYNFRCNNKIIGARFYAKQNNSTRDSNGHGTHTASTAAGNLVYDVGFYGLAQGNARGGVPSARIAAYKVCKLGGCSESDVLAGFDDAIADGVDIISVSLGQGSFSDLDADAISIGAFHAMQKGILTSQAAGNDGPIRRTTASVAPWILSVAASTTDRHIINKVVLGNGEVIQGNAINSFTSNGTNRPLIYGKDAISPTCDEKHARLCWGGCLANVTGKIVLCDEFSLGEEPFRTGASGTILLSDGIDDYSYTFPLSATHLILQRGALVKAYMNSTQNPTANILKSEAIHDSFAPVIASFSSRGPNGLTPSILKPDISAPGVDILAAYSLIASPSTVEDDKRSVKYAILSGTSMACPHATGAAAYVKSFHPDWSPSAIKSALMTTALPMNATKNPDAEFAYGAGNIDPMKAINPGLIYEILEDDYIKFLCNIGWDIKRVRLLSGNNNTTCQAVGTNGTELDLNYPAMTAFLQQDEPFVRKFTRTVKNVGSANSTYSTSITSHSIFNVTVNPTVLHFESLNQVKSFIVTVSGTKFPASSAAFASLEWLDGTHTIRSPIVVHSINSF